MHEKLIVFNSADLQEKSQGLRFDLPQLGEHITGFVVRFDGNVHAYVNQCAHVSVELDWNEGDFFTPEKDYLVCATHGAQYQPNTGFCVFGPCKGKSLRTLPVTEQDQQVIIHLDALKQSI